MILLSGLVTSIGVPVGWWHTGTAIEDPSHPRHPEAPAWITDYSTAACSHGSELGHYPGAIPGGGGWVQDARRSDARTNRFYRIPGSGLNWTYGEVCSSRYATKEKTRMTGRSLRAISRARVERVVVEGGKPTHATPPRVTYCSCGTAPSGQYPSTVLVLGLEVVRY